VEEFELTTVIGECQFTFDELRAEVFLVVIELRGARSDGYILLLIKAHLPGRTFARLMLGYSMFGGSERVPYIQKAKRPDVRLNVNRRRLED
jgi:hypothetical protein